MQPLYSTNTVSLECKISLRQLYYWELIGLIKPLYENFGSRRFRRYTGENLNTLKQIKSLLDSGFTLQAVRDRLFHQGRKKIDAEGGNEPFLVPSSMMSLPSGVSQ